VCLQCSKFTYLLVLFLVVLIDLRKICMKCKYVAGNFLNRKLFKILAIKDFFNIWVSVHHKSIVYNKPTRCNSGSIVFIKNYKYTLQVSDALCLHHQEHY